MPRRESLPDLGKYARYMDNGTAYPAGYVEASRGCLHTCRHCPVVPIYNGRFFIVPVETVLADIRQQVMAGAQHITFGDPDFLNGPGHARKLAQALHAEFPGLSFDFTTKVEHILAHGDLLAELADLGRVLRGLRLRVAQRSCAGAAGEGPHGRGHGRSPGHPRPGRVGRAAHLGRLHAVDHAWTTI